MDDFRDIGEQLYQDGYNIAREYYDSENHLISLRSAQLEIYEHLDAFLDEFILYAGKSGKPTECRAGCSWCCFQKIYALSSELEVIKEAWFETEETASQNEIIEKATVKSLSTDKNPCPFLNSGKCKIYPLRPVACRIYLSSSERSCISDFEKKDNVIPELFEVPLYLGRMMNEGFVRGLQSKGMKVEEKIIEEFLINWV